METVDLRKKMALIDKPWVPKVVGELNGQYVKVVKVQGEYVWHQHAEEDEMFLVLEGNMVIHFRDGARSLGPGEFLIVPRGVEHKPAAEEEAHVLLFEPASTRNTGNVDHAFTIEAERLEHI